MDLVCPHLAAPPESYVSSFSSLTARTNAPAYKPNPELPKTLSYLKLFMSLTIVVIYLFITFLFCHSSITEHNAVYRGLPGSLLFGH